LSPDHDLTGAGGAPHAARRTAAFLDMDETLVDGNTAYLYAKLLRREGKLGFVDLLRSAFWLTQYRMNWLDMPTVSRRAFARLAGDPESELLSIRAAWFEEMIRPRIFPAARALVETLRRAGRTLVIVTASTRYAAEPLAEHLGIEHLICSELEVRGGHFTGRIIEPLCYGTGKVHRVRAFATARGIDLASSLFYTDSYSDLPLLEAVGHRVAVNPDSKLAAHAGRNGWPILRFRRGR
jgi:HAD superfamily hydrolase (TIGR01490 family)